MAARQCLLSRSSFLFHFLHIVTLFLFFGCGPAGEESPKAHPNASPAGSLSIPIPVHLQKHLFGEMAAEIFVVDTGQTFPLAIDLANRNVSGSIQGVVAGEHTFELNFIIQGIKVATARTVATIVADSSVAISFGSLTFPDNDGDGFTNLAELEAGTEVANAGSHPPAELPRSSANYVMSDLIGISPFVGTSTNENKSVVLGNLPFGSTQKSTHYTVTAGP
jgi:hypothetical protein